MPSRAREYGWKRTLRRGGRNRQEDLVERQNHWSSAEYHDTSNSVHDIDPKIDAKDPDSDDDDELHQGTASDPAYPLNWP